MERTCTVKLVYKDHPREQQNVVPIHSWSSHAGSITQKAYAGQFTNVFFINRWSFYSQVVFTALYKLAVTQKFCSDFEKKVIKFR